MLLWRIFTNGKFEILHFFFLYISWKHKTKKRTKMPEFFSMNEQKQNPFSKLKFSNDKIVSIEAIKEFYFSFLRSLFCAGEWVSEQILIRIAKTMEL